MKLLQFYSGVIKIASKANLMVAFLWGILRLMQLKQEYIPRIT
jgi:hypothetical protein